MQPRFSIQTLKRGTGQLRPPNRTDNSTVYHANLVSISAAITEVLSTTDRDSLTLSQLTQSVRDLPSMPEGYAPGTGAINAWLTRWTGQSKMPEGWYLDTSAPRSVRRTP